MLVKTKGIVLRTTNYSETSIIASIYTLELGLRSYIIKGVRQTKSKKGNIYQPLQVLDMIVNEQANKKIQYIKEAKIDFLFNSLRFDIRKAAIGLFIIELVNNTVHELEANPELFHFIIDQLKQLDEQQDNFQDAHLVFMLAFSQHLGFRPLNNYSEQNNHFALQDGLFVAPSDNYPNTLSSEDSELFYRFIEAQQVLGGKERSRVLDLFERYMSFHIPSYRQLKTPNIFHQVFHQ